MTSQEADRFMLEHPEVAVKASVADFNPWVAWNNETMDAVERRTYGKTREQAIDRYKSRYHPEKPRPGYENVDAASKTFRDSAKYRRIVKEYARYVGAPLYGYEDIRKSNSLFTSKLWEIIEDDYSTHCRRHRTSRCDKCGQSVAKSGGET